MQSVGAAPYLLSKIGIFVPWMRRAMIALEDGRIGKGGLSRSFRGQHGIDVRLRTTYWNLTCSCQFFAMPSPVMTTISSKHSTKFYLQLPFFRRASTLWAVRDVRG